jgi:hypothetical protein
MSIRVLFEKSLKETFTNFSANKSSPTLSYDWFASLLCIVSLLRWFRVSAELIDGWLARCSGAVFYLEPSVEFLSFSSMGTI